MIDEITEGGSAPESHEQEIPFPAVSPSAGKGPKYIPCGNNILLDYEKPTKAGLLHLPPQQRPLDTIVCEVLACGPEVKRIVPGQRVALLTKALIGGTEGLLIEGRRVFLSQEQVLICVVEPPLPQSGSSEPALTTPVH